MTVHDRTRLTGCLPPLFQALFTQGLGHLQHLYFKRWYKKWYKKDLLAIILDGFSPPVFIKYAIKKNS